MSQQLLKECKACKKQNLQLLRCSKCKKAYYCDINCQKNNWPEHKLQCNTIQIKNPQKLQPKIQQKKQNNLNQFDKLQPIGHGNFSIIYGTKSKKDNIYYAIKQVQKAKVQRLRKQADVFMEKHCLSKLKQCQYVVKLYKTFQDDFSLYFQMECPKNGQLWQQAKSFGIISQSLYKYYLSHIVKAIYILHQEYSIVHRDLKPENILLTQNYAIKIIDFGTAKDLSRPDIKGSGNGAKGKKVFEHYVGTPNYMAPQCIHNKASQKVSDIYSLSGVFYFLKTGSPPFAGASQYLVFTKSLQTKFPKCSTLFSQQLYDLMDKMNQKQLQKRYTIQDVMNHSYFKDTNFNELIIYQQAYKNQSILQLELSKIAQTLNQQYSDKFKLPIEERKSLYEDKIKIYLKQSQQNISSKIDESQKQKLYNYLQIIDIQCQCLLNIKDDNNISFTELFNQLKIQ